MKKILSVMAIATATFLLSSCGTTKPLYSWHNYEDITYRYSKKTTDELQVKVLQQYQLMTEKQKALRGVVPPGLYAEYGFLLCKTGKKEEGLEFMKKEVELYPESDVYVSRIIKQLEK